MNHRRLPAFAALLALLMPIAALAQPMAAGFREGVDYYTLPKPVAPFGKGPKMEVAEVFSYACIHCFHFQPLVNAYKKTMAKDVRWEYVPAAFGGPFDTMGRAYFAAQQLGVQEKTHDAVFAGIFEQQKLKQGTPDEVADLYAGLGVDRAKFMAALRGEAVAARFQQARGFAMATGVEATPTLIVNGKYRVLGRQETGMEGMLKTADFLLAKDRAAAKAKAASAKPAPAKPAPKPSAAAKPAKP
jgi:thiol:disulfide interchange protein DsbA